MVLEMYREGWFPMYEGPREGVRWLQPEHRGIIPLDEKFHVSRSLRQRVRSGRFLLTSDLAFDEVIRACGQPASGREDTWLHPEIVHVFGLLHRAGLAHSVEAWLPPAGYQAGGPAGKPPKGSILVGGLYGLHLGSVFCGESMFSRPALGGTDASKVCLVSLVERLRRQRFTLLDAQLTNEHLNQFGLFEMPRAEYLLHLSKHADDPMSWA
ncbi:Leucyl/phenylalanyl-tRNA--protein transferase [Phycisphaerales bacterium]|nr:Leucyl/phenylalanyl-tRNA--protein transferase [Phycisphaerales bacterium]